VVEGVVECSPSCADTCEVRSSPGSQGCSTFHHNTQHRRSCPRSTRDFLTSCALVLSQQNDLTRGSTVRTVRVVVPSWTGRFGVAFGGWVIRCSWLIDHVITGESSTEPLRFFARPCILPAILPPLHFAQAAIVCQYRALPVPASCAVASSNAASQPARQPGGVPLPIA
jgi:hypothetical protein